jgi:hypothetical protein
MIAAKRCRSDAVEQSSGGSENWEAGVNPALPPQR